MILARLPIAEEQEALRAAMLDALAMSGKPGWLQAFIQRAWPIVEPRYPLIWNWHLTVLCEELERVAAGLTRELVICVPPGTAKSLVVSVLWPAAMWLRDPGLRILGVAHIPDLSTRDALKMKDVVTSPWYRGLVAQLAEEGIGLDDKGRAWDIRDDQRAKVNYLNTVRGSRQVGSIKGGITGIRVDGAIVDDPYNALTVLLGTPQMVAERMAEVVTIYDGALFNRVDSRVGWRVVIMQRLHREDLAGELIKRGVRCVVLPFTAKEKQENRHPRDPRLPGELIFPVLMSAEYIAAVRASKGGVATVAAQYEQSPTAGVGKLFKREWFVDKRLGGEGNRYDGPPERIARGLAEIAITVDCAFKKTAQSDRVALLVWGRTDARKYLLDCVAEQMTFSDTLQALVDLYGRWPKARMKLVEGAANGPAVLSLLQKRIPGLIEVKPEGGKFARAQVSAWAYEAGEVYLPQSEYAPWMGDWIERHVNFTGQEGGEDDEIDAESQLFARWDGGDVSALERVRKQFGFLAGRAR